MPKNQNARKHFATDLKLTHRRRLPKGFQRLLGIDEAAIIKTDNDRDVYLLNEIT